MKEVALVVAFDKLGLFFGRDAGGFRMSLL
jgi:hypothetical protein